MVDDFGEDLALRCEMLQLVEFREPQNRRLLDENVLPCFDCHPRGREVAIVGRGDADDVDRSANELLNGVCAGVVLETADLARRPVAVGGGAGASSRGDGCK